MKTQLKVGHFTFEIDSTSKDASLIIDDDYCSTRLHEEEMLLLYDLLKDFFEESAIDVDYEPVATLDALAEALESFISSNCAYELAILSQDILSMVTELELQDDEILGSNAEFLSKVYSGAYTASPGFVVRCAQEMLQRVCEL
jgi:hypothetical protein